VKKRQLLCEAESKQKV